MISKAKILIVEDDYIIALDLKEILEELDYEVIGIVATADDMVEKVKKHEPDLVLLDISLKGEKTGIDAANKVRETSNVPILYVTAYTEKNLSKDVSGTEPYLYLIKPYDINGLSIKIKQLLGQ